MPKLRLLRKYPFSDVVDCSRTHRGRNVDVYKNETSMLQSLDLSSTDDTLRRCVEKAFAPQNVSYLSGEEIQNDNVFDCLNPLTSRYATDRCLRQQIFDAVSDELKKREQDAKDEKEKKELKAKYDEFIKSLS